MGFAYQKSGFHIDESASVAISTGSWIPKFENGEFFGKELKEKVYFDDNSISDLWRDLKELWKNNYGDGAAHPNLYYSLLRAWSFDMKTGDFAWIKSRGIGLNLVFFAFGFYAVFILMTKIFSRHSLFVPLFLAFAFWNSAGVTNSIFIRPYALQEMLLLVFTLNCFVFYGLRFTSAKDAFKTHKFFFAWFIFATALLCLSHYFSLFFIAFAFIFLAILSRKNIFPLSVVMICSLIIAQIFYRDYFAFLNGYRAKESMGRLMLSDFTANLNQTFSAGADIIATHFCNIYGFAIILVACGIMIFMIYKTHALDSAKIAESRQNFIFLFGFFIIGVVWFWLIFFVAPFKDLRYVMPIFPFLYFGVLLLFVLIKKPLLQGVLGIAFVASLFANYNVQYLYKTPFIFTQNPQIPVLVHLPNYSWEQGYFLFAFYDTQRYIIEQDSAKLWDKIKDLDAFYMISETPFSAPAGFKQGVLQVESYGFFYLFEHQKTINKQTLKNNANFLLQYRF